MCRLLRKEGAVKRGCMGCMGCMGWVAEGDGALGSHHNSGIVRVRAVVVPAVDGDRHAGFIDLDALQP